MTSGKSPTMTSGKSPTMTDHPGQTRLTDLRSALTLRRRIVGSIALLSAIGLLLAGLAAILVERNRIVDNVGLSLQQEMGEFRELATNGIDPDSGTAFDDAARLIEVSMQRNVPDANETHIGFTPRANIGDGGGRLHLDPEFRSLATENQTTAYARYQSPEHGDILYAVLPIEKSGEMSHYVVAHYLDDAFAGLQDTIKVYGVAALLAWLGLCLAAWMLARHILAPIEDLSRTAASISETDLNQRITVTGGDEVSRMGATFNLMLDRLQAALGSQRRMLDDAGHELRTPITVIRGHLELMDSADPADVDSTRDLAIDELDRMNLLVQDLLLLAKSQRPDFLTREPVELHVLIDQARHKASALGERTWLLDPSEPLSVFADPRRLTQALLQLASNAFKVTEPGDVIAFGCSSSPRGVQLWVRDSGPGVPEADRARIFDRFQAGTGVTTGGTGLGLPIVRAIAEAHGGTATVTDGAPGGGAKFILEIPRVNDPGTGAHTVITDVHPALAEDTGLKDTRPRTRERREHSGEHSLEDYLLGPREEK